MNTSSDVMFSVLNKLKEGYYKLLLVNFTTDYCKALMPPADESFLEENQECKISSYFEWFLESELIHCEDVKSFREFSSNADMEQSLIYRRRIDDSYRHVVMSFVKTINYTDDNKECILYVKDIENLYQTEYNAVSERLATTDASTKLLNRFAYDRDKLKQFSGITGVMYCDLNGLKFTNDNYGHEEGDKLIQRFADMLKTYFNDYRCYRVGGDEFIVIAFETVVRTFIQRVVAFHKFLWRDGRPPIASVGYSADVAENLPLIIKSAEQAMYEDKDMFNDKYPKLKRK